MQSNTQFITCILLCQLMIRSSNSWRLRTFRTMFLVCSSSLTSLCPSKVNYVYSVLVDSGLTHRRRTNVTTPCRHPGSGDEPAELQPSNALRTWSVIFKYHAKYSDLCLEYCARCSVPLVPWDDHLCRIGLVRVKEQCALCSLIFTNTYVVCWHSKIALWSTHNVSTGCTCISAKTPSFLVRFGSPDKLST